MLAPSNCSKRKCKHFLGIRSIKCSEQEALSIPSAAQLYYICKAFPDGIPDEMNIEKIRQSYKPDNVKILFVV